MNLMDMIKGAVSKQVMGQIGGILGTDEKKTSSAFENVAGGILGGLIKKSQTPQGASDIFDMAKNSDDGILDKLGDILGGGQQSQDDFFKKGGGMLEGILGGGQQQSSMIGTIAKALGLDEGMIGKLLMMAAPIIMGVIGKHLKNKALDAVGLKGFLGEQSKNIAGSMLPGLSDNLGFGNLLGNVSGGMKDMASSATGAVTGAAGAVGDAANQFGNAAADAGSGMAKLIVPLVLLGALIVAGVVFLPKMMGGNGLGFGGTKVTGENIADISEETDTKLKDLAAAISEIADLDGAKEVAPKFADTTKYISSLNIGGMTPEELSPLRSSLTASGSNGMVKMNEALGKAYKVSDEVKDFIRPLFDKLYKAIEKIIQPKS